jgi:hypothetical protein
MSSSPGEEILNGIVDVATPLRVWAALSGIPEGLA